MLKQERSLCATFQFFLNSCFFVFVFFFSETTTLEKDFLRTWGRIDLTSMFFKEHRLCVVSLSPTKQLHGFDTD